MRASVVFLGLSMSLGLPLRAQEVRSPDGTIVVQLTLDAPVGTIWRTGLGFTFPALFRLGDEGWVLVSETGVSSNYVGSRLGDPTPAGLYRIAFPEPGENGGIRARRSGDRWYVAATQVEKERRELTLPVPFLAGRTVTLIHDASNQAAAIRQVAIGADGQITLSLEPGGGAVLFE